MLAILNKLARKQVFSFCDFPSFLEKSEHSRQTTRCITPLECAHSKVDLGPELGTRRSCAQLTVRYRPEDLEGRLVVCACDLEPRQIGRYLSEVLVTGVDAADDQGGVCLIAVDDEAAAPGTRVY